MRGGETDGGSAKRQRRMRNPSKITCRAIVHTFTPIDLLACSGCITTLGPVRLA